MIFLIGYRGTGKSTIGPLVAQRLGWSFVDSDDEIARVAGKSIAQIFADDGEQRFRDLETRVVARWAGGEKQVMALGGGAVLRSENRRVISVGSVVWLSALPQTISRRLGGDPATCDTRPRLTALDDYEEIEQLLARRAPVYRECADVEVDTEGKTVDDVADEIVGWWHHKA